MVTLYSIHSDGTPVYLTENLRNTEYEEEQLTPTSAKLTMEDNKSGILEFSLLPDNIAYDEIELMNSTIKVTEYVYDDDGTLLSEKILWKGRVISIEEDINNIRTFTCEGALAFLNDIVCYPISPVIASDVVKPDESKGIVTETDMKNEAFRLGLQEYLDTGGNTDFTVSDEGSIFRQSHVSTRAFTNCIYTVGRGYNNACAAGRRFKAGRISIANVGGALGFVDGTKPSNDWYPADKYPNGVWSLRAELTSPTSAFATALDQILDITANLNGGHLLVRHEVENGEEVMYLDYLGNYGYGDSSAEYGVNVIEFNGRLELNAPVTDIIPRGAVVSTWNNNDTADEVVDTEDFKIDDIVDFKGTRHYVASTSDIGYKCTPGKARITNINLNGIHPFHLIHTGTDSTVYGWVDQSDIEVTGYATKKDTEFTRRGYKSYPYTEYVGITDGYKYGTHVVNETLMKKYGRIQQIVDFPDIDDPDELRAAGEEWLKTHSSFLKQSYEVSLVDLGHVYGTGLSPIHLLDRVHVSMPKHGIDEYMPVTKIVIDLLNPADTVVSFSKETTEVSSRKRKARGMARAIGNPTVELNQPNDSISQSLARNIKYISETSDHAKINTSLTQDNKNTMPNGMTGNVDVVTRTWVNSDGSIGKDTQKLTFANGLLCTTLKDAGPAYDFFGNHFIKGAGIIRPVNDTMYIRAVMGDRISANKHALAVETLFGDRFYSEGVFVPAYMHGSEEFPVFVTVDSYPYYFTDSGSEADDLILETNNEAREYGLYYRLVDGVKKYFPMPCIYYLPSGYTGDLYVFYVGPINMSWNDDKDPIMFTQKVANLGAAKYGTAQLNVLKPMFADIIAPTMNNDLKRLARQNSPSYTKTSDLVSINTSDYGRSPCTALLIAPLLEYLEPYASNEHSLYVSPALVLESDSCTYINGVRRPNKIKIYTGHGQLALPRDYKRTGSLPPYMPDMFLECAAYERSEVKTEVTKAKYYIFGSKDDLQAIVDDYKSGLYTQSQIEQRHKPKIIAFGNSYNKNEAQTKMQLNYRFNGIKTSYYIEGHSDPFYGS